MKRIFTQFIAASAALLVSINSMAGLIVDTVEVNEKLSTSALSALHLNFDYVSYTHNLMEPSDAPFTLGSAYWGELSIEVWDDQSCSRFFGCHDDFAPEVALFVVEDFDLDTGGWNFGSAFVGELEVNALAAVNSDGKLDVKIKSLFGDFHVGISTLTLKTRDDNTPTAVPEPATTALLAFGVAALILGRRAVKKQDQ